MFNFRKCIPSIFVLDLNKEEMAGSGHLSLLNPSNKKGDSIRLQRIPTAGSEMYNFFKIVFQWKNWWESQRHYV